MRCDFFLPRCRSFSIRTSHPGFPGYLGRRTMNVHMGKKELSPSEFVSSFFWRQPFFRKNLHQRSHPKRRHEIKVFRRVIIRLDDPRIITHLSAFIQIHQKKSGCIPRPLSSNPLTGRKDTGRLHSCVLVSSVFSIRRLVDAAQLKGSARYCIPKPTRHHGDLTPLF